MTLQKAKDIGLNYKHSLSERWTHIKRWKAGSFTKCIACQIDKREGKSVQ